MKDNEWQVTNLELSKRLKELGYPQESLWCWLDLEEFDCKAIAELRSKEEIERAFRKDEKWSAPTVAELGEKLPAKWRFNFPQKRERFDKDNNYYEDWHCTVKDLAIPKTLKPTPEPRCGFIYLRKD